MHFAKLSCAFFLLVLTGCGSDKSSYKSQPNPVRDLLIDRIFWTPKAIANRPGTRVNEHRFSITNTSSQHRYRQIQLRFDYFDDHFRRIDEKRVVIDREIEAATAVAIPPIQAGITHPLARSAEVRVEKAVAD
ncbi:hypothetical protein [Fibrella forsythiae]|uniref:DUF1425 domain-containing protein n=1 Tax=Fibrella forsythiae TaxID=2817061 RepID=A0ABS3JCG7_9BACT|nr:hypothetical protein [Fibrella forsythiae]MBO0947691.1 hypothetical protein [Fibrella forsythiae]